MPVERSCRKVSSQGLFVTSRHVNVDSTVARAHQHAVGAPKAPPPSLPGSSKGAPRRSFQQLPTVKKLRDLLEEAVRPAKGSAGRAAV
ncbi:hypothetical protein [Streptomyces gelaticus]